MKEKQRRLKPQHAKFLKAYAECGDIGKAYLSAGYKCKNKNVASACGSKLLKKYEFQMDLEEKFQAMGLGDLELLHIVRSLLYSKNEAVRARVVPHAMRARKWIGSEEMDEKGAQIVIRTQSEGNQRKEGPGMPEEPARKVFRFPAATGESD